MKFKKNDTVMVTGGKDKGKSGKILKVIPEKNLVLVEGVNKYVKHLKKQGQKSGEKVLRERPLPTAKVAIWNPDTKKIDRIGYLVDKGGSKIRIYKKTGKAITA
jgi:large subunit ribosomal protein L24